MDIDKVQVQRWQADQCVAPFEQKLCWHGWPPRTGVVSMLNMLFLILPLVMTLDFFYLARRPGLAAHFAYDSTSFFSNYLVDTSRRATGIFFLLLLEPATQFLSQHSLHLYPKIDSSALNFLLLFLIVDFAFYLWHRLSHNYRYMWIGHQIHHQDLQYNYSTASRVGSVEALSLLIFFCLFIFLGVPAKMFMYLLTVVVLYTGLVHSSLGSGPRWLEWFFNTPANHRLHHERGLRSGRCNYGAVLLIWDHLFGTYVRPRAEIKNFGVAEVAPDIRPMSHQFLGLIPWLKSTRSGHRAEELFSKKDFTLLVFGLACFAIPICLKDQLSALALLIYLLLLEIYPVLSGWKRRLQQALILLLVLFVLRQNVELLFFKPTQFDLAFYFDTFFWWLRPLLILYLFFKAGRLSSPAGAPA